MKKSFRQVGFVGIGLLLLGAVSGCGFNENQNAGAPTVIRFMAFPTPDLVTRQEKMCRDFEALHPNIQIDYSYIPGFEFYNRVLTAMAGGAGPDVFWSDVGYALCWIKRGLLLDLSAYVERDLNPDDYIPKNLDWLKIEGHNYGVCDASAPIIMSYNKNAFDRAGVPYPDGTWNWNDFREAAKKLTLRDEQGRVIQYGYAGMQWEPMGWPQFIVMFGAKVFSEDGVECTLDSQEAIDALTFLRRLYTEDQVMPPANESENTAPTLLFLSNRGALLFSGPWLRRDVRGVKDLRWGITHVPYDAHGKRHTLAARRMLVVNARTKHPDEVWEFIRYQMTPECQQLYLQGGDSTPTLKSLAYGPFCDVNPEFPEEDNNRLYVDAMDYALGETIAPYIDQLEINSLISPEIDRYLILGEGTAEEAVGRASAMIRKVMVDNKEREEHRARISGASESDSAR